MVVVAVIAVVAVVDEVDALVELDFAPLPPHAVSAAQATATLNIVSTVRLMRRMRRGWVCESSMLAVSVADIRWAGLAAEAVRPARDLETGQAAVAEIVTGSFLASFGSGIVTSTTPSCVFALIFLASTPGGSAIEREKDP